MISYSEENPLHWLAYISPEEGTREEKKNHEIFFAVPVRRLILNTMRIQH